MKNELLKLVKENPNAEVLIMCSEDSHFEDDDYGYTAHYLNDLYVGVEMLACYRDHYYDDKEELEQDIKFSLCLEFSGEKLRKRVKEKMKMCEFKKYIVVKI